MGVSERASSTGGLMANVLQVAETIMDSVDPNIRPALGAATSILRLVDTFHTNREDLQFTATLVAELTKSIMEGKTTAGWKQEDISFLTSTLQDLHAYLVSLESDSSNWMISKYDQAKQIATAERIAEELNKHNARVEKAAFVLQLKFQVRRDIMNEETHDAVKKSVKVLKGYGERMDQMNEHMSNYTNKLDAVLEIAIQTQRTKEQYQHEVAIRNRPPDPDMAQSLEQLQLIVDERAQSEWRGTNALDLKTHVQKWMLPSTLVEFDYTKSIGHGASANVYKGVYFDKPVAVKCFHGILSADSHDLERDIVREIKQWSKVSKLPYVLSLIGVCTKVSRPLIVSEWCPHTIVSYVDQRPNRLLPMVYEFICGLASIHEHGVVHRDLKGSNVLVTEQNHVAITDFGLSKSTLTTMSRISNIAPTGYVINWSSPEMRFQARRAGPPADIWSFAMTVYQLLSKEVPYQGRAVFDIENALRSDDDRPCRPANLNSALDPLWKQLERCWLRDPKDRPTAQEFQKFMEDTYNANSEPNMPPMSTGSLFILVSCAKGLRNTQIFGTQDPYVEITFNGKKDITPTHDNGHTAPYWDSLLELKAPPKLDMNQSITIRVMNENWKILGHNEIASVTTLTIGQLLEVTRQNQEKSTMGAKGWFRLHPKGHILINAFLTNQYESMPKPSTRVTMKHVCAVEGAEDAVDEVEGSSIVKSSVCVLGPFGSGKSTLINSIFGHEVCKSDLWGGCTQDIKIVGDAMKLTLVDTPSYPFEGDNTKLNRALMKCRVAVLVFEKRVAEVLELAKMAIAAGCSLVFVRSKRELLPLVCKDQHPANLSNQVALTLKKDHTVIEQLLGVTEFPNFYIDALAALQARLPDGQPLKKELLQAWIDMLTAIWKASGIPVESSMRLDLKESVPYL
ncbi:unnamed protein product [Aphanomyces euteiches]